MTCTIWDYTEKDFAIIGLENQEAMCVESFGTMIPEKRLADKDWRWVSRNVPMTNGTKRKFLYFIHNLKKVGRW